MEIIFKNKKEKMLLGITLAAFVISMTIAGITIGSLSSLYLTDTTGLYYPNGMIVMKTDLYYAHAICAHEIGHQIYYQELTPEERALWEKIHEEDDEFVSEYAKTNAAEDFAETYRAAIITIVDPDRVAPYSKRKANFLKNNVYK